VKFLVLVCLGIAVPSLSAQGKIGYVDFQYLVSQVKSADEIQTELQRLAGEWTKQIASMQDSLETMQKDLEAVSLTLTKSSRDILQKNIETTKQKIALFQEQKFSPVKGDLYKKQQELLQPMVDKIKRAIDNVRIREKYDVIFDISAGNPVSIDKRFDLTALVIEELSSVGLTVKEQAANVDQSVSVKNATTDKNKNPIKKTDKDVTKDQKVEKKDQKDDQKQEIKN